MPIETTEPGRGVIGLIPAAGIGSRLPDRPGSKEMVPVGVAQQPAIAHLLDAFSAAGIDALSVVLRREKRDIVNFLSDAWAGRWETVFCAGTSGVPETVALGLYDQQDAPVAFGFPDILFEPATAFDALLHELSASDADVVLGLFPTDTPQKMDMVALDADNRVARIEIKPASSALELTWILAVWRPSFSRHLIASARMALTQGRPLEHLGHALQAAMRDGLVVRGVPFPGGRSLDIGTPDDLVRAQRWPA